MQAQRIDPLSAIVPLLRYRALRVLLVAAPGVTAAVAILTATESNLAFVFVLNVAVGVIISSTVFLAVSLATREVGNERMNLARATEEGQWRARAQLISISNDETGLYADWYFHLRLQEEIARAVRYDTHFAVLIVTPFGVTPGFRDGGGQRFVRQRHPNASTQLRYGGTSSGRPPSGPPSPYEPSEPPEASPDQSPEVRRCPSRSRVFPGRRKGRRRAALHRRREWTAIG